ncbi:tetratricopeptide repeat protein [Paenibacillus sp. GYB003]|uniref:tetratricopeptide repeat protein n=1 Tax=Paenibacillus sp. GYB003 TaxID=2994392 RepID=UPI002F963021
MLKQLFATMNDTLDEVMKHYPNADAGGKQDLHKKLELLKTMSDSFIEEWLHFEEKLSRALDCVKPGGPSQAHAAASAPKPDPLESTNAFKKGQGYYQLLMFDNAAKEFEKMIEQHPDFLLGRLYLAMSQMRLGNDVEAYRHFRFITSFGDQAQMKAVCYNAMGCIQAKNANMHEAQQLFKLAFAHDPTSVEPMINMGICMSQHGGAWSPGNGFIH